MIPQGVEVFVAVEPVDMRLGFERLGGLVRERMGREPRSRALFVFFGRRRQTVKVLSWDGTGTVLWYKRLDRGLAEKPPPRQEPGDREPEWQADNDCPNRNPQAQSQGGEFFGGEHLATKSLLHRFGARVFPTEKWRTER